MVPRAVMIKNNRTDGNLDLSSFVLINTSYCSLYQLRNLYPLSKKSIKHLLFLLQRALNLSDWNKFFKNCQLLTEWQNVGFHQKFSLKVYLLDKDYSGLQVCHQDRFILKKWALYGHSEVATNKKWYYEECLTRPHFYFRNRKMFIVH